MILSRLRFTVVYCCLNVLLVFLGCNVAVASMHGFNVDMTYDNGATLTGMFFATDNALDDNIIERSELVASPSEPFMFEFNGVEIQDNGVAMQANIHVTVTDNLISDFDFVFGYTPGSSFLFEAQGMDVVFSVHWMAGQMANGAGFNTDGFLNFGQVGNGSEEPAATVSPDLSEITPKSPGGNNAIPEPVSFLIWLGLAGAVSLGRRKRRRDA